jgi:hypothetical protein
MPLSPFSWVALTCRHWCSYNSLMPLLFGNSSGAMTILDRETPRATILSIIASWQKSFRALLCGSQTEQAQSFFSFTNCSSYLDIASARDSFGQYLYEQDSYTYGLETLQSALMFDPKETHDHQYRVPILADYNNMCGLIAQSIASVTTSGYYGAAEVCTTGSTPRPVYLVRTYVLAIVVAILFWNLTNRIPLRSASFLTIANAVRGPRWDAALYGGCLMSPWELRHKYRGWSVMYGVDE